MSRRASVAIAIAFALAVACGALAPRFYRQLATGAGVAAKAFCSLEFVSGLDRESARAWYIAPLLRGHDGLFSIETDVAQRAVTARIPGIIEARAVDRPGYGCTLVLDESAPLQALPAANPSSPEMALDRAHRASVFDAARLDAAVAREFAEEPDRPPHNTLAVVVLHDGRLVAERYAQGVSPETRLPGWSMSKSVTTTLVGVLVELGRLDVNASGAIREWRGTDDPRSRISIDHLLRMTSGLLATESGEKGSGLDPTSRMLYGESDAAHFAATRTLQWEVGAHFEYMSANTVLAMRAVQDAIGGDLRSAHDFIHENLLDPLDMQGTVLEPDQAGTFLGCCHMLATARDWARFGQLYVDGGRAGGRRLIPEDWIDYVTTPTPQSRVEPRGDVFFESGRSAYGAGFWLFSGGDERQDATRAPLPPDAFDANGFQGQYLHIIPSKRLVVLRLGATNYRGSDHERLPHEVIEAMTNRDEDRP